MARSTDRASPRSWNSTATGSPGERSTVLHNLTDEGFAVRQDRVVEGKVRKYYRITPLGRRALQVARDKALELIDEITEDEILVGGSRIGCRSSPLITARGAFRWLPRAALHPPPSAARRSRGANAR
jgi:hypothetical protein